MSSDATHLEPYGHRLVSLEETGPEIVTGVLSLPELLAETQKFLHTGRRRKRTVFYILTGADGRFMDVLAFNKSDLLPPPPPPPPPPKERIMVNCQKNAEFSIATSPKMKPADLSHTCLEHLGVMVSQIVQGRGRAIVLPVKGTEPCEIDVE